MIKTCRLSGKRVVCQELNINEKKYVIVSNVIHFVDCRCGDTQPVNNLLQRGENGRYEKTFDFGDVYCD